MCVLYGSIFAVAALVAAASASVSAPAIAVHSQLVYMTKASCDQVLALPSQQELLAQLLPNERFSGTIKLVKTAQRSGCTLRLDVVGGLALATSQFDDAFAVTSTLDEKLLEIVETKYLRGATHDLTLQRISVTCNERDYSMAMASDDSTQPLSASSVVTLEGRKCDQLAAKNLLDNILPGGVDAGDVKIVPGDVESAGCAVGLDIVGQAPPFGGNSEAFAFLKAIDDNLDDAFGNAGTKTQVATLAGASVKFTPPRVQTTDLSVVSERSSLLSKPVNAPTKEITLGILVGISVLSAMLFGISYQKKRHEQNCQERHDNASRAAQIRRVSYRMGYDRVASVDLGAEEEEKDGLL